MGGTDGKPVIAVTPLVPFVWMATHIRSRGMGGTDGKPVIAVTPLRSMPYVNPASPSEPDETASVPTETKLDVENGPSLMFIPSRASQTECNDVMDPVLGTVKLTGAAAMGSMGPIIGKMNIWESEDSYLFRVSLPGVLRDEKDFSFDIQPDGTVIIKGVTTTGERIVCRHSRIFKMLTQNLCPPGNFSITFQLPGPVDTRQVSCCFGTDGMFEGAVKKTGASSTSEQG